jgi:hypothetical protein
MADHPKDPRKQQRQAEPTDNCVLNGGEYVTLDDVRAAKRPMIYYGAQTCWWTHRAEDLATVPEGRPGAGLPCDPRGGVLLQTDDVEGFLAAAEAKPESYGRHRLKAFEAAHHGNVLLAWNGSVFGAPTCFRTWEAYNVLLDERYGRLEEAVPPATRLSPEGSGVGTNGPDVSAEMLEHALGEVHRELKNPRASADPEGLRKVPPRRIRPGDVVDVNGVKCRVQDVKRSRVTLYIL